MAGPDDELGMTGMDGMPALDDVMRGSDSPKSKPGGKDDDDMGFDLDDRPFDPFAPDNKDDRLENDPANKAGRKDEVVFEVADDDDDNAIDDDDFKDNRKKGDPRKMSRLQREMKLKKEARDKLGQLGSHVDRLASEVTMAKRNELHTRRALGEMALSTARRDLASFAKDLDRATEAGDREEIGRISRAQAESESIILKAEALIERYSEAKVNAFVFNPEIPEDIRDANRGGTSKGKDWIDANAAWFGNPDQYGAEIAFARAADAQLAKEGKFDVNSDAYYEELTRRVATNMRNIEVYTNDGRLARVGERQRGGGGKVADTTGSSSNSGSNQQRRPATNGDKRETISAEEQHFLGKMGLDFKNPEHLKELKANRVR